jgi:heat shock protein HtpX
MAMMISRKREFLADASAAELTRNPHALAKALQKLENASAPTAAIKRGIAHLCIVDPLGKKVNEKEGFWSNLFATHPPMQKRIMLLKAMSYQQVS